MARGVAPGGGRGRPLLVLGPSGAKGAGNLARSIKIGRTAAAVVVGFLLTEAAVIVAAIFATRFLSDSAYLWANAGYHYFFAAIGGYVAATIGRERGTLHGMLVGVLIVGLGLLLGAEPHRGEPRWYPAVFTFGGAVSASLGGLACSRIRRHYSAGHYSSDRYSRPSRSL